MTEFLEADEDVVAKDFLHQRLREEVVASINPCGVVKGEAAGSDDAVDVGMSEVFPCPGV